jgi:hypothetical protein
MNRISKLLLAAICVSVMPLSAAAEFSKQLGVLWHQETSTSESAVSTTIDGKMRYLCRLYGWMYKRPPHKTGRPGQGFVTVSMAVNERGIVDSVAFLCDSLGYSPITQEINKSLKGLRALKNGNERHQLKYKIIFTFNAYENWERYKNAGFKRATVDFDGGTYVFPKL